MKNELWLGSFGSDMVALLSKATCCKSLDLAAYFSPQ